MTLKQMADYFKRLDEEGYAYMKAVRARTLKALQESDEPMKEAKPT